MSVLAQPPIDDPEAPEIPEDLQVAIPKDWSCPRCPYRIPLDFPGGTSDPIAAHENGHLMRDMGIAPRISWDLARAHPGTPRR